MEPDRLRPGRLPEDVVLEDAHTAIAGELGGETSCPLGEHLRGDDVVGLPRVAELPRAVLGVAAGHPVHLVGPDARLVLAVEQRDVALAEQLEPALGDEPLLEDQEAVASKDSTWSAVSDSIMLVGRGLPRPDGAAVEGEASSPHGATDSQERGLVLSGS